MGQGQGVSDGWDGIFPRLAHHSTSGMKHRRNVLFSVSLSHCFSFIYTHTQPFPLSSLIFLYRLFFPSLWPNYFPLRFAPPVLCLSLFLYIVRHNFTSSFRITSCIFFSFFASPILSIHFSFLCETPLPSSLSVFFYPLYIWLSLGRVLASVGNLSLSQQPSQPTDKLQLHLIINIFREMEKQRDRQGEIQRDN